MKKIKSFKDFKLDENSNLLKFSYRGTELPTQEMIDWFGYETNQSQEHMDSLEQDEFDSILQKNFFEEFSDELMDLSYFEMIDVYNIAKSKNY